MSDELDRLRYEIAVRSADGPRGAIVRYVVLTIASYCRRRGSVTCWPSLLALEAATDLARRTIVDAIRAANDQKWLEIREEWVKGKKGMRKRNVYVLRLPSGAADAPEDATPPGAADAPEETTLPVQKNALPVQMAHVSGGAHAPEEPALHIRSTHEVNHEENHEEELDMKNSGSEKQEENPKTRRQQDVQPPEPELTNWHRRQAIRLGIERGQNEPARVYASRIVSEYAQRPDR